MTKIAIIGGLGMMLSPAAKHLHKQPNLTITKVFDRQSPGKRKDEARGNWQKTGATLTNNWDDLVSDQPHIILICAGKNGNDLRLIKQLLTAITQQSQYQPSLVHLSTVSAAFATSAHSACQKQGIVYVNYPLTGGPVGAEAATMLILTSGERKIHDWLYPILSLLGQVCYFGPKPDAAAVVKLLGHTMVFNNLMGICTAATIACEHFSLALIDEQTAKLLSTLNQGAGQSKQWPLALKKGVVSQQWQEGFLIEHAVIDLVYVLEMMAAKKMPLACQIPLYTVGLCLCYLEQEIGGGFATHTLVKTFSNRHRTQLDRWIQQHFTLAQQTNLAEQLVALLPAHLAQTTKLNISDRDFIEI